MNNDELPDPADILREAEQYQPPVELEAYSEAIDELKRKGLSFRKIASWFKERGIAADHNAVWRVYTKDMSDAEVDQVAEEDNEHEGEPKEG